MKPASMFASLLLGTGACDATEPEDAALQLGRYEYASFFDAPGSFTGDGEHRGVLRVTSLAPMIGDWEVPGFDPAWSGPSGVNGREYLIGAKVHVGTSWLILHNVRRRDSGYTCEATASVSTTGGLASVDVDCSLTYLGP